MSALVSEVRPELCSLHAEETIEETDKESCVSPPTQGAGEEMTTTLTAPIEFIDFDINPVAMPDTDLARRASAALSPVDPENAWTSILVVKNGSLWLLCNDQFYSASSDAEQLTAENIGLLERARVDIEGALGKHDPSETMLLFCCRARKMRPQNPIFEAMTGPLREFYSACGPARTNRECG